MQFKAGNKAILNHENNKKKVLLFQYIKTSFVRYEGEIRLIDYEYFRAPDKDLNIRKAIRFIFEKTEKLA